MIAEIPTRIPIAQLTLTLVVASLPAASCGLVDGDRAALAKARGDEKDAGRWCSGTVEVGKVDTIEGVDHCKLGVESVVRDRDGWQISEFRVICTRENGTEWGGVRSGVSPGETSTFHSDRDERILVGFLEPGDTDSAPTHLAYGLVYYHEEQPASDPAWRPTRAHAPVESQPMAQYISWYQGDDGSYWAAPVSTPADSADEPADYPGAAPLVFEFDACKVEVEELLRSGIMGTVVVTCRYFGKSGQRSQWTAKTTALTRLDSEIYLPASGRVGERSEGIRLVFERRKHKDGRLRRLHATLTYYAPVF